MELLHECKLTDGHFKTELKFFYSKEDKKIKVITDKGREAEIVFDDSIEDDYIVTPTSLYLEIKKIVNEPRTGVFILENCIKALEKIAKYDTYEYFYFTVNNDHRKDLFCVGEVCSKALSNGRIFISKSTVGDFSIKIVSDFKYLKESVKNIPISLAGGLTARGMYNLTGEDLRFFYSGYKSIFIRLELSSKEDK